MDQKRKHHDTSGFTLTEVLVSIVLMALALAPVMHALARIQATGTKAQRVTQALFLAESTIEDVRAELLESFDTDFSVSSAALSDGFLCTVLQTDESSLLKIIEVEVGYDDDGDGVLDSGEIVAVLNTKVADKE